MKSIFIPAALVLCLGYNPSVFSYESRDPSLGDHGLILGFGASKFVASSFSQSNNRFNPGITLGFYQDFNLKANVDLEFGFMLSAKGSRLDATGDLYLHQFITYLELPLRAIWSLLEKEKIQLFISGGSYLGIKLLAFNEVGFPEDIRGFDVGLDLGAGVKFQQFSFRLVANQGFLNLDQSNSGLAYKNQSFFLAVGVMFGNQKNK
jgi:hypothetical protein